MSRFFSSVLPSNKSAQLAVFLYIFGILVLFFYTFTQIDLSLTLTRASIWQPVQRAFQDIGYFQRPLSAMLYVGILLLLFLSYIYIFFLTWKKRITKKQVYVLIGFVTVLLALSYNAFSYDLFNYIFDAKIITHYSENPYLKKALDFPGDPMLSFMRWTHRVYPYGPGWLGFTVPLSLLGMNTFLLTFFLFKFAIAVCFFGTVYFLGRISSKISQANELLPLVFFGLNPFVLIESVISGHNDIVMMFFAVLAVWLVIEKKWRTGIATLLFSISIKFVTLLLIPFFAFVMYLQVKKRSIPWEKVLLGMAIVMLAGMYIATSRTNFQPWYFLYAMPFLALLSYKKYIVVGAIAFSLGSLAQYIPYLYLGNYDPPVPFLLVQMFLGTAAISLGLMGGIWLWERRK